MAPLSNSSQGFPEAVNALSSAAPHRDDYRAAQAGAPGRVPALQWLASLDHGDPPSPSWKNSWPSSCPGQCLFWPLGLGTLMGNKAIYATQCGRLFKPSTRGSRTFLVPAHPPPYIYIYISAEGGENSCLTRCLYPPNSLFRAKGKYLDIKNRLSRLLTEQMWNCRCALEALRKSC